MNRLTSDRVSYVASAGGVLIVVVTLVLDATTNLFWRFGGGNIRMSDAWLALLGSCPHILVVLTTRAFSSKLRLSYFFAALAVGTSGTSLAIPLQLATVGDARSEPMAILWPLLQLAVVFPTIILACAVAALTRGRSG